MIATRILAAALIGLVVLASAAEADARRRAGFRSRGLPNEVVAKGPTLTRDQLRSCVADETRINAKSDAIGKLESGLQAQERQLEQMEARIKQREPLVDSCSQACRRRLQ